jgi:hypothetical protein
MPKVTEYVGDLRVVWGQDEASLSVALRIMLARCASLLPADFGVRAPTDLQFLAWVIGRGYVAALAQEVLRIDDLLRAPPPSPNAPARGQMWFATDPRDDGFGDVLVVADVEPGESELSADVVLLETPNAFDQSTETWDVMVEPLDGGRRYTYLGEAPPELRRGFEPPSRDEALRLLTA